MRITDLLAFAAVRFWLFATEVHKQVTTLSWISVRELGTYVKGRAKRNWDKGHWRGITINSGIENDPGGDRDTLYRTACIW
jgi:hypothetical protein